MLNYFKNPPCLVHVGRGIFADESGLIRTWGPDPPARSRKRGQESLSQADKNKRRTIWRTGKERTRRSFSEAKEAKTQRRQEDVRIFPKMSINWCRKGRRFQVRRLAVACGFWAGKSGPSTPPPHIASPWNQVSIVGVWTLSRTDVAKDSLISCPQTTDILQENQENSGPQACKFYLL